MPPGLTGFNGSRLREAREARLLTGVSLAELAHATSAMISQYEHGKRTPQSDVLQRIADALRLPVSFFLQGHEDESVLDSPLTFRSFSSATKGARTREDWRFRWHVTITHYLERFVALPQVRFPDWDVPAPNDLSDQDIDLVATKLRRFWGLDDEPISDLVELAERNGAVVVRYDLGAQALDAYSAWSADRPHIILGADKMAAVRSRYDAVHEIAHLVLHRQISDVQLKTGELHKEIERQANFFAGSFLLPAGTFAEDFTVPTLDAVLSLKPKWRVSVGAMIFRAEWLSLIPEDQARRLWISYGRRGWRNHEPFDEELPIEQPRTLRAAFDLARQARSFTIGGLRSAHHYSDADIEQLLGLPHDYLRDVPHGDMHTWRQDSGEGGDSGFRLLEFPTR